MNPEELHRATFDAALNAFGQRVVGTQGGDVLCLVSFYESAATLKKSGSAKSQHSDASLKCQVVARWVDKTEFEKGKHITLTHENDVFVLQVADEPVRDNFGRMKIDLILPQQVSAALLNYDQSLTQSTDALPDSWQIKN